MPSEAGQLMVGREVAEGVVDWAVVEAEVPAEVAAEIPVEESDEALVVMPAEVEVPTTTPVALVLEDPIDEAVLEDTMAVEELVAVEALTLAVEALRD